MDVFLSTEFLFMQIGESSSSSCSSNIGREEEKKCFPLKRYFDRKNKTSFHAYKSFYLFEIYSFKLK